MTAGAGSGLFDGFDWNTHPALFGYAATLAASLWLVWRLLRTIERLVLERRAGASGTGLDQEEELGASDPPA